VAPLMRRLFDQYLGADWALHADDPAVWQKIDGIPDAELWRAHCLLRARLVAEARYRAEMQWREAGESDQLGRSAKRLLNPDVLTIGFARRVATYKRWNLLLSDMERAIAMLNHPTQPVQFVLAGKAHPRDNEAKRILQQLMQWKERRELRGRVVFLSGYDQYVARRLVQGVDVWLNLPVPPLEASGTSGMKVVVNGGLNCSILDGWWIEGSNGENGWDIGTPYDLPQKGRMVAEDRNEADAASLHDIIENQIRPLFYDRNRDGVPRGWVARMRASMKTLAPAFSATRMVKDYAGIYYP
jgi:starch phosphorylase